MKITKTQLKQIIKEELETILEEDNLDEITSRTKAIARMRGVPHMGSGPLPKPEEPETEEEISKVLSNEDKKLAMAMKDLGPDQIKGIKDELEWEAEGGSYSPEDLKARILQIYSQAHGDVHTGPNIAWT